jgi:hypothetical protein
MPSVYLLTEMLWQHKATNTTRTHSDILVLESLVELQCVVLKHIKGCSTCDQNALLGLIVGTIELDDVGGITETSIVLAIIRERRKLCR